MPLALRIAQHVPPPGAPVPFGRACMWRVWSIVIVMLSLTLCVCARAVARPSMGVRKPSCRIAIARTRLHAGDGTPCGGIANRPCACELRRHTQSRELQHLGCAGGSRPGTHADWCVECGWRQQRAAPTPQPMCSCATMRARARLLPAPHTTACRQQKRHAEPTSTHRYNHRRA